MENENYSGPTGDGTVVVDKGGDDVGHVNLTEEATKVKFTNDSRRTDESRNGDAKVDIENVQVAFAGMGKDELMKFANDPFWIRLRWSLFILFWLSWLAMLVGAIVVIVLAPRCKPLPTFEWWHKSVVYQVYPKSFQDSNGDGVGDLEGIESRLDYIDDLGVKAIWLSPIFKSPMVDNGYDISNYLEVDKMFGTLEDFEELVKQAKEKGIRVIIDFVPNHTSNQSEWFEKSRTKTPPFTDYYVWQDGKNGGPPNNWLSVFGGSAWTYDSVRQQYYLHQFLPEQPDLNFRSQEVKTAMEEVLHFWLDKGVSGFRVDAAQHLYEDEDFEDEPLANDPSVTNPTEYGYLSHIYTAAQPENIELVAEWRKLLDKYSEEHEVEHRLLMVESYEPLSDLMRYYGNSTEKVADFPFNFGLITNLTDQTNSTGFEELLKVWLGAMPDGAWPNWVLGNHDKKRIGSRIDSRLIDGMHMTTMLLTGTPVTYYGEEIGMTDTKLTFEETQDNFGKRHGPSKYEQYSRDPSRTPMQWANETSAGFTNGTFTWLPVNPNYKEINVKAQQDNPRSHLNVYKSLVKLREEPAIVYGSTGFLKVEEDVFGFSRVKKGSPGYVVLINFGQSKVMLDLASHATITPMNYAGDEKVEDAAYGFPEDGTIEMRSGNATNLVVGKVRLALLSLEPKEAMLIKFVPVFKG